MTSLIIIIIIIIKSNASVSICVFLFSCYRFVEAIVKMITIVTKYIDILIFNFAHTIQGRQNLILIYLSVLYLKYFLLAHMIFLLWILENFHLSVRLWDILGNTDNWFCRLCHLSSIEHNATLIKKNKIYFLFVWDIINTCTSYNYIIITN